LYAMNSQYDKIGYIKFNAWTYTEKRDVELMRTNFA
jgi:hypothetical protein